MIKEPSEPRGREGTASQQPREIQAEHYFDRARQQLIAIVEGSDDAILTKDLNGVIMSWNKGAERVFGYTAEEALGEPITMLIPPDRHDKETMILARIRAGERVDHYETVRQRKDGSLIHISLTVSPLRDENGVIVGASKIARDVSERHRLREHQRLLLREMQHRVKNAFSLASSLIGLCERRADTASELAALARPRLDALARAHALTVRDPDLDDQSADQPTTLHALVRVLISAFVDDETRFALSGEDLEIDAQAVTPLALVINELITNAAKHGALTRAEGRIAIDSARRAGEFVLTWVETGIGEADDLNQQGFGTRLSQMAVETQLGGTLHREWNKEGLTVTVTMDISRL